MYRIYCDSLQEGMWFRRLNRNLADSKLILIPNRIKEQQAHGIDKVLIYDRPDIILADNSGVILVVERTVEVPSGHNVGQRFGRLVAAAKEGIPAVYFGPYMAYKHGGVTAGPRYMNLRLFYSLEKVSNHFHSSIITINWPVDRDCEVLKTPEKDIRMIEYLRLFFDYYNFNGFSGLTDYIRNSRFHDEQIVEQEIFAAKEIRDPDQYNKPPASVSIMSSRDFERQFLPIPHSLSTASYLVVYHVGMNYIRSDPYVGMAALYYFLYREELGRQILYFPNISYYDWQKLRKNTKTYTMFKEFCDAILFSDKLVLRCDL